MLTEITKPIAKLYLLLGVSLSSCGAAGAPPFDISRNIFTVQNTKYLFNLTAPIQGKEFNRNSCLRPYDKYSDAIRFIKKEQHKTDHRDNNTAELDEYYIQILIKGNQTYLNLDKDNDLSFSLYDDKMSDKFIWKIIRYEKDPSIIQIIHKETTKAIGLKKETNSNIQHICMDISDHLVAESSWRLHPFYYYDELTDLYQVLKDYGHFLARIHNAKLKSDPIVSSMDKYRLSIEPKNSKVALQLKPHDNYNLLERVIFTSNEIYAVPSGPSVYKFSRATETESRIETTVTRTISRSKGEQSSQGKSESRHEQDNTSEEASRQFYISQSNASQVHLDVSISKENGESTSKTVGSSESKTQGSSQSNSYSSSNSKGGSATVKAGGVFVEASATVSVNQESNSSQSSGTHKEEAQAKYNDTTSAQTKSTTGTKSSGTQENKGQEKSTTNSANIGKSTTKEKGQEYTNSEIVNVESVINFSELNTTTKTERETFLVEREVCQAPNTMIRIKIVEQVVHADSYSFIIPLKARGHVGYKFEKETMPWNELAVTFDPFKDFRLGDTWYISIESIFKMIAAPGFHFNATDLNSLDYHVKAKLNLRKPTHMYTIIEEEPLFDAVQPLERAPDVKPLTKEPSREINNDIKNDQKLIEEETGKQ